MGRHSPRRAQLVFTQTAEQQIEALEPVDYARLDLLLDAISLNPLVGDQMERSPMLRQYVRDGARCIYYSSALGTVVVVAYLEV